MLSGHPTQWPRVRCSELKEAQLHHSPCQQRHLLSPTCVNLDMPLRALLRRNRLNSLVALIRQQARLALNKVGPAIHWLWADEADAVCMAFEFPKSHTNTQVCMSAFSHFPLSPSYMSYVASPLQGRYVSCACFSHEGVNRQYARSSGMGINPSCYQPLKPCAYSSN